MKSVRDPGPQVNFMASTVPYHTRGGLLDKSRGITQGAFVLTCAMRD